MVFVVFPFSSLFFSAQTAEIIKDNITQQNIDVSLICSVLRCILLRNFTASTTQWFKKYILLLIAICVSAVN